ncbi:serine hydrolase domain-containing protein [Maricaulis sp.]|uniref:serine hydrolase domain-containing protein n=1 Tax=Maricaulis sp. TaxID=1486257 RepID=UPI003A920475
MSRPLLAAAALFSLFFAWPGGAGAQDSAYLARIAEATFSRAATAINRDPAPGISVAVLLPGGHQIDASVGVADRISRETIGRDTRFLSGSVGKTVTGLIATELASEGVIDLDAPISTWLSGQTFWPDLRNADAITLRMLLNHTAGVPDYLEDPGFFLSGFMRGERGYTPAVLVGFVADEEPINTPGTAFSYSDTHYILVGLILEAATGQDYHSLVRERVIEPLGLTDTQVLSGRDHDRLASGHVRGVFGLSATARNHRLNHNLDHEWAAGGLVTTPGDLAQLYSALGSGELSGPGAQMRANAFVVDAERGSSYGLGLYVRTYEDGAFRIAHGGDFGGYRSAVVYDSQSGITIAVQANGKSFEAPDFAFALMDEIAAITP